MSRLSRKIAWRYLFSKKSHSAINAISIVLGVRGSFSHSRA